LPAGEQYANASHASMGACPTLQWTPTHYPFVTKVPCATAFRRAATKVNRKRLHGIENSCTAYYIWWTVSSQRLGRSIPTSACKRTVHGCGTVCCSERSTTWAHDRRGGVPNSRCFTRNLTRAHSGATEATLYLKRSKERWISILTGQSVHCATYVRGSVKAKL